MSDVNIKISVEGSKQFRARFKKFGSTILELDRAMNDSGKYLSKFFSGQMFTSRGGIVGKPWQPLNDDYAADKARRFPGRPPLIRSGAMNRGYRHDAKSSSVFMFNKQFYFEFHQNGNGVPQRITMALDGPRLTKVGEFIGNNIEQNMETAGV
jgi:hypothetical protein